MICELRENAANNPNNAEKIFELNPNFIANNSLKKTGTNIVNY